MRVSVAHERSKSGNTDWFAFIRAQRWVFVVGSGQSWEVFVVNREVLRLFVRWFCDHSNCRKIHFNKDYCDEHKTADLITHLSGRVLSRKDREGFCFTQVMGLCKMNSYHKVPFQPADYATVLGCHFPLSDFCLRVLGILRGLFQSHFHSHLTAEKNKDYFFTITQIKHLTFLVTLHS